MPWNKCYFVQHWRSKHKSLSLLLNSLEHCVLRYRSVEKPHVPKVYRCRNVSNKELLLGRGKFDNQRQVFAGLHEVLQSRQLNVMYPSDSSTASDSVIWRYSNNDLTTAVFRLDVVCRATAAAVRVIWQWCEFTLQSSSRCGSWHIQTARTSRWLHTKTPANPRQ